MLVFVYGTTGELIKIAPVIRWAQDHAVPFRLWCTGQQLDELPEASEALGLPEPDRWLARGWSGHSLRTKADLGRWLARLIVHLARHRRLLMREATSSGKALVVVHGDTITTPVGAALGRAMRCEVAHVEAGLRSGTWRSPFPEELDRRVTTRLATVHFAPGEVAVDNLRRAKARGAIVDTQLNTVFDAMNLVRDQPPSHGIDLPARYGLVSIHRAELIEDAAALRAILDVVAETAAQVPLVFVDHPVTHEAVQRHGLERLLDTSQVIRVPKQRYEHFIQLVVQSAFVVTDSGGLQEECGYLGHPCVVHREVTERAVGLGRSVVLSKGDIGVVREFLKDPDRFRSEPTSTELSPTAMIGDWLLAHGYGAATGG